jgi:hypothetical protein
MSVSELTVNVEVQRIALWRRLMRTPKLFGGYYRIMRRGNGRFMSAYGAWLMTGMVLKVR